MGAVLRDFAAIDDKDPVRFSCIDQAMRDHDDSLAALQSADPVQNDLLTLHVDVAGRLVENIDRAVVQKRPREGEPLPLAAGKILGIFSQLRVKAVSAAQELVHSALRQDLPQFVIIRFGISHQKILPDSPLKQVGTGAYISDAPHDALLRAVLQMVGADHDRSAVYGVAACEKGGDGGFAAAALSYDPCEAVLRDLHGDSAQHLALSVIGEADAL